MPLDAIQIREAFHLLVLEAVGPELGLALRVKGGVNLRLFYGSERYSEDMDLDADPRLRRRLKRLLANTMQSPPFRRELLALGIRDVDTTDHPAKDTDTVLRYKAGLIVGGVRYPTKIEVSYRGDTALTWATLARPLSSMTSAYLAPGRVFPVVGHYRRNAALYQKIRALALRSEVQARDVFDLGVLLDPRLDERAEQIDLRFLRAQLTDVVLQEAVQRALDIAHETFRDQVVAFLAPAHQTRHTANWESTQVAVASLIERVQGLPHTPDHSSRLPHPQDQSGDGPQ